MDDPLVSIIIPIFNRVELLNQTLKSINLQTFRDFEIILIDDASEDIFDIKELQNMVKNSSLIYHKLNINGGPGAARCKGRSLAHGKYIAYLDSDDTWVPTFLAKTVSVLERQEEVSMVFTNVLIKRPQGSTKRLELQEGIYNFFELIFKQRIYWATGAALWRAKISLSTNWKPYRDHEDYMHDILSLIEHPQIYHIPELLCIVNKNESLGIKRSTIDMLQSLLAISKSDALFNSSLKVDGQTDYFEFVWWRLSKRRYLINDLSLLFKLYFSLIKWSANKRILTLRFLKLLKNKLF